MIKTKVDPAILAAVIPYAVEQGTANYRNSSCDASRTEHVAWVAADLLLYLRQQVPGAFK